MIPNFRLLMRLGGRTRVPALLTILALGLIGAVFEVVGVGLVFPLISLVHDPTLIERSAVLAAIYDRLGLTSPRDFMLLLALSLVAVFLTKSAYMAVMHHVELRILAAWKLGTSRRLMASYMAAPYHQVVGRNSADPVRTVASLVPKLFDGFIKAYLVLAVNVILVVGITMITIALEPAVAAVAVVLPLLYLQNRRLNRRLGRLGKDLTELARERQKALQESFGALREVKALGREEHFLGAFGGIEARFVDNQRRTQFTKSLPPILTEAILTSGVLLLIIIVLTADRSAGNTLASLGLLAAASFRLAPMVTRILSALNTIRHGEHSARLILKELEVAEQRPPPPREDAGATAFHELQLDDVSFCYPESDRPSLHNVTLTIRAGESIGVVGPSGAGKSTLADIVLGLFEPSSGTLRVDGTPIRSRSGAWREAVGYVPQSVYVLDDTIRRNVAFGLADEAIADGRVWRALEQAQIAEHIRRMAAGLDAVLGEHGARLSAGQRQRIGIARALYRDPALLVLDEATSTLDAETENEVASAIAALKGRKTLVVIAHRHATLEVCDRLILLRDGRIEAIGKPSAVDFAPAKIAALPVWCEAPDRVAAQ